MIGHYLLSLTPEEEERVLTSSFTPIMPRPGAMLKGPCLCLLVGRASESSRGVSEDELFRGRTRGTMSPGGRYRNRMPGHVYENLCQRFGWQRINAMIRTRILANQARRMLGSARRALLERAP